MSVSGLSTDDLHPIDLVQELFESRTWDFNRVNEDHIAVQVEGSWRTYTISLAWAGHDDMLRLVSTFEMDPPEAQLPELYKLLDLANDQLWGGAFSLWREDKLMVYRYGLVMAGGGTATTGQVETMMRHAVEASERLYPAFQLVCQGDTSAEDALEVAIAGAFGRA